MIAAMPPPLRPLLSAAATIVLLSLLAFDHREAAAQIDFERAPINYSRSRGENRVSELIAAVESGQIQLEHDASHGYLKSLLRHLDVSTETQTLVFSKTSHQRHRISPETPRALYFNDEVYLGWVQGGTVIEISAADPHLGAVFYTIDQRKEQPEAKLTRQFGRCTLCHASTHTGRIPGHIVRSVYPDKKGMPILTAGTFRTTDQSPISKRWGGWYVTGTHGTQRHMGNVWAKSNDAWKEIDVDSGANIQDLSKHVDLSPYLTPHSDIVALMVMEHQIAMHNLFTAANIEWRLFWKQAQQINRDNQVADDHLTDESVVRLRMIAQRVADGLLMKNETILTGAIRGTSNFQSEFAKLGPTSTQGGSLRQFDLNERLFRYACSYMIYSESFDALDDRLREKIYDRLWTELVSPSPSDPAGRARRQETLEILRSTKDGLPASWRETTETAAAK